MAITKESLKFDDKITSEEAFTYAELAKEAVDRKRKEFDDLKHQVSLKIGEINHLTEVQSRQKADFDLKLSLEQRNFELERKNKLNDLSQRESRVVQMEQGVTQKLIDLSGREKDIIQYLADKRKLENDRIVIENLKAQAQTERTQAEAYRIDAQNKLNELALREPQIDVKIRDIKAREAVLMSDNEKLNLRAKELAIRWENLQELKAIIDPRLAEIEEKSKELDGKFKDLRKRESDLLVRQDKNKKYEEDIVTRMKQLSEREKAQETKEKIAQKIQ